jgi:hypothetical protein
VNILIGVGVFFTLVALILGVVLLLAVRSVFGDEE